MKRFLRGLLLLVIIGGIMLALWPVGQAAYGWWSQRQLHNAWQQNQRTASASHKRHPRWGHRIHKIAAVTKTVSAAPISPAASSVPVPAKWPATRLIIPEIGVDAVVVQGWDDPALRRGPGHDPRSGLPGEPGNCVIAAHRNVYGAWFSRINELWAGSKVQLKTPDDTFTYHVLTVYAVADSDVSVRQPPADPNAPPQLTLLTCTIPHTPSRIVVVAQLDDEE